jgi:chemotaxis protein MotA
LDKGTVFGIVAGSGLILLAILTGSSGIAAFFNPPGVLIVLGGTLAATAVSFPTKELKLIPPVMRRVFNNPETEMLTLIRFLLECKKVASKEGPLALERMAKEAPSGAIGKGLTLIADGTDSRSLREILATERRVMEDQHRVGQKIFSEMGKLAPAFGMIGTLIGLVQMLATLDDPASIGPSMAVALLTTLYGALLANLLFIPMVSKLDRRIEIEAHQIQAIIAGMSCISGDDSIALMREKMKAFLLEQPEQLETAPAPAEQ